MYYGTSNVYQYTQTNTLKSLYYDLATHIDIHAYFSKRHILYVNPQNNAIVIYPELNIRGCPRSGGGLSPQQTRTVPAMETVLVIYAYYLLLTNDDKPVSALVRPGRA